MTAQELQEWRVSHSLTQVMLAERLGVHVQTVARWEQGARDIPPYLQLALQTIDREVPTA